MDASGKGELPAALEGSKKLLTMAFYSPSFAMSRIALLNPARYFNLWWDDPAAAKLVTAAMGKFVGATAGTLALAQAAGFQVDTDSESPDFLKIKTADGKFRYDISGGTVQYIRLAFRLVRSVYDRAQGNTPEQGKDFFSLLRTFGRGKLSPGAGLPVDWYLGKDGGGKDFDVTNAVLSRALPLPFTGMYEALSGEGLMGGLQQLPDVVGIGTSYRPDGGGGRSGKGGGLPSLPKLPELPQLPKL
jgi:hypothetical protein